MESNTSITTKTKKKEKKMMKGNSVAIGVLAILSLVLVRCAAAGGSTEPITVAKTPEGEVSFSKTVLPNLTDHCRRCHGEDREGNLYILNYDGVMKGGKSGSFVIPGSPDNSRIITSVEKTKPPHMPPRIFPALTLDRINAIHTWITEGAKNAIGCHWMPLDFNVH